MMNLAHVAVSTADLEGAVHWYHTYFDFREERRFEKEEYEMKGATLAGGDLILELLMPYNLEKNTVRPSTLAQALRAQGLNHISLNVDNLEGLFHKMKDNGECLVTEIVGGRFFFCCDPDGTVIEVRQK